MKEDGPQAHAQEKFKIKCHRLDVLKGLKGPATMSGALEDQDSPSIVSEMLADQEGQVTARNTRWHNRTRSTES